MTLMGLWGKERSSSFKGLYAGKLRWRRWSKDEDLFIVNNYAKISTKMIAKEINRTVSSVRNRASVLRAEGLIVSMRGRWSDYENNFLVENCKVMSYQDISRVLGRSRVAVIGKMRYMGLVKNEGWSIEDVNFLKLNYKEMSNREMAKELGKTYFSVQGKVKRLRLRVGDK